VWNLVDRTVTRFGRLDAAVQSENERNKAVVDQFFKAGIQGPPHDLRQYLHPDFAVAAPNHLPWGGRHAGAAFFRGSESLRHSGRARKTATTTSVPIDPMRTIAMIEKAPDSARRASLDWAIPRRAGGSSSGAGRVS